MHTDHTSQRLLPQIILTLICIIAGIGPLQVHAQGEVQNWVLPTKAGMSFQQGAAPIPIPYFGSTTSYSIGRFSGFSLSDPCGNLMLYWRRDTLWNASHQVLTYTTPTGGENHSYFNCPDPGNPDRYYLIRAERPKDSLPYYVPFLYDKLLPDLRYQIFDRSLNGGNGGLVPGGSFHINDRSSHAATVIRHANGTDFWIVNFDVGNGEFHSYLVSASGISQTPVISPTNGTIPNFSLNYDDVKDYTMRANPQGDRVAMACAFPNNELYLMDFDNTNGSFGLPTYIVPVISDPLSNIWHVAFSPNGELLYYTAWFDNVVHQLEAKLPTQTAIQNSIQVIHVDTLITNTPFTPHNHKYWAIQLSPDGHVYLASMYLGWYDPHNDPIPLHFSPVSHIPNPDVVGPGCGFVADTMTFGPYGSRGILPFFPAMYFRPRVVQIQPDSAGAPICDGDTVSMSLDYTMRPPDSIRWWITDGNMVSMLADTARYAFQQHGWHEIEAWVYLGCPEADTVRDSIWVDPTPRADLGIDTSLCQWDAPMTWSVTQDSLIQYLWSDGSSADTFAASQTGTYWVETYGICGAVRDTVHLRVVNPAPPELGPDRWLCALDTIVLDGSIDLGTYLWTDGSSDSTLTVTQQGTYIVEAANLCGTFLDTLTVLFEEDPWVDLGPDSILCEGDTLWLAAAFSSNGFSQYAWQNGATGSRFPAAWTGTFHLTLSNFCGSASDTVRLEFDTPLAPDLGPDSLPCEGEPMVLDPMVDAREYRWQDGSDLTSLEVGTTGTYSVSVSNACGNFHDSVDITRVPVPVAFLGNDTTLCFGETLELAPAIPGQDIRWGDGSGGGSYRVAAAGTYSVTTANLHCMDSARIDIGYAPAPVAELGPDRPICGGSVKIVDVAQASASYRWDDGTTDPRREFTEGGTYWVAVTTACATAADTLILEGLPRPMVELGPDAVLCQGDSIRFDVRMEGASYEWADGFSGGIRTIRNPGYLHVTLHSVCGSASDERFLHPGVQPEIRLEGDSVACEGTPVRIRAWSSDDITWPDGSGGEYFLWEAPGPVWASAWNECGTDADTLLIRRIPCGCPVTVPNAFSPNGDGPNETISPIHGGCSFTRYRWQVFARNGQLLFSTQDPSAVWDGTHRGAPLPQGAYAWTLDFGLEDGTTRGMGGVMTLIR
ncbi:gliding motility-associated C-terminal domain-containing protein [Pontibacter sp. G13]|uniref:T9SS type B sorting domain-containing protein n=1 Tax=Pontibacter sp. G13 TaxID=3074898 RepID=UPI00288B2A99|nr:gliding motility-associated C-terminal domain-containing protein [Pontibacter sp. G13]WNJ21563.1 gliding motility-associated C-terminal domain-containing protein [Pontibacter sp. G13]